MPIMTKVANGSTVPRLISLLLVGIAVLWIATACDNDGARGPSGEATTPTPGGLEATAEADGGQAADYSERGPYDVGVTTLTLADERPVDVWYPAAEGATEGLDQFSHNLNDPWPDSIRSKLPEVDDIVLDAYLGAEASPDGPFPVLLASHGFGGSRRDGSTSHSHIASWGFIVIAPEHLERNRATVTGNAAEFEVLEDSVVLANALDLVEEESNTAGSLLEGLVDAGLVAVAGHSAGGRAALEFASDARVDAVIGLAAAGPDDFDPPDVPVLLIASDNDNTVELTGIEAIYDQLVGRRILAVVLNGGHNTFSDACAFIRDQGGLDVASLSEATGFPAELLEAGNNGCIDEFVDPEIVWPLINHLQVAHIRAAFGLDPDGSALDPAYVEQLFPGLLADYRSDP